MRESFQGASKTEDPEFDALKLKAEAVVASAARMRARLACVQHNLQNTIEQYQGLSEDITQSSHSATELQDVGKKIELASQDFKTKFVPLEQAFNECLLLFTRFLTDAGQVDDLVDDRKTKMLEYDFFRNKLDGLRASPPQDTSRIPRNEGRMMEWQRAYEDSNAQVKKLFQSLILNGEGLIVKGTNVITGDVARYYGEVSKTSRLLFLGSSLSTEAHVAMANVQQAAANAVQQSQAAVQQAASSVVVQAVTNPSSRRFFVADDPFRTD